MSLSSNSPSSVAVQIAAALCCVVAAPAFGAEVLYLVSGRADVRGRSAVPGDQSSIVTGDVELQPSASIAVQSGTRRAGLLINPSVLFREPHQLGPVQALVRARLNYDESWGRSSFRLTEDFSYGVIDVGATRTPEGAVGTLPTIETRVLGPQFYMLSATRVSFDLQLNETMNGAFDAGYAVSGGLYESTLPFQHGPFAAARYRWNVTNLDALITAANFLHARFDTGQIQTLLSLTEGWTRRLTATMTLDVQAGVAFNAEELSAVEAQAAGQRLIAGWLPYVSLGWSQSGLGPGGGTISLVARVVPFVDRFTAQVYERAEFQGSLAWSLAQNLQMTVALGAASVLPLGNVDQSGDRVASSDFQLNWTIATWLNAVGSIRAGLIDRPRLQAPIEPYWLAAVGFIVHSEGAF